MRIIPSASCALLIVALCAAATFTSQCGAQELDETQTTTTVVRSSPLPPPPLKQEVIVKEPSAKHVWIPGSWEREPNKWVWNAGRWVKPPFLRARYIPGYWRYDRSKYVWQSGHWATADVGLVVEKPIAPPPDYEEPIPVSPDPEQQWIAGHWNWNGLTWSWSPGFYATPPQREAVWVAGHWRKGLLGFYRWTPGHWAVA